MDKEIELEIVRRAYAKQMLAQAGINDARVEAAFAAVPRERYLGPGPWSNFRGFGPYTLTPSDDPVYLYTDGVFAIRPQQHINNGQPSLHVLMLASANVKPGDHVVHVGAGVGYYSAIAAHLAGSGGRVTAIEFEPELAALAKANLASLPNVEVIAGDATTVALAPADVIYANASFARIPATWLDAMRDGGRLILPMSARMSAGSLQPGTADFTKMARLSGANLIYRIERRGDEFHVDWLGQATFIAADGLDAASESALVAALESGGGRKVTRLYRHTDIPVERCWLRGDGWCLAYS